MCVPVRFNFCVVRFIFAWFDSFFAVLIFCDRFSFYENVSTSARILPRTADLVFDSLLRMFDSFFRFNSCLRSSIYFLPGSIDVGTIDLFLCVSLYLYAVRFIFVRFDSFVYGSIYVCAGSIQFLCGSIYFCVVGFLFCCFNIL